MRFETNFSCSLATAIVGTTMLFGGTAFGQCTVTPPPGTIATTDGCAHLNGAIDNNGGCNATPNLFTDLGALSSGGVMNVSGQMGLYIPTAGTTMSSRDLDWFLVSCPAGTLQVSLSTQSYTGTGQMPSSDIFIKANVGADPCLGSFDVAIQSTACPHIQSITAGAGQHLVVVTTEFDTTAVASSPSQCGTYLMTLSHTPLTYPICGTATASCTEVHAAGGCNLPACCDQVCSFNPLCCDIGWDQGCVDSAVSLCGLFIYNCAPPPSAPLNDCAIASQLITIGQGNVYADNTNAGTDGPGPAVGLCSSAMGKDLWYTIKTPADGSLTVSTCTGDQTKDSVMEIYGLGTDPVMTSARAQTLPDLYIGCNDDSCGSASQINLIDALANNYYLIRIGGYYATGGTPDQSVTFSLPIVTTFENVVFTTGPQQYIVTTAGANTNLGLSSGCIAAPPASQQRWIAAPFTVPSSSSSWNLTRMTVKGFQPAGSVNATLNYVVWRRLAGNPAPLAADQVVAGSVPMPTAYNNPLDSSATSSYDIAVSFNLPAGDYYLTAYASNPDCATGVLSNFAWFVCAYNGVNLLDATNAPFGWRSQTFPSPGFVKYTGLNGAYHVQTGADPNDLYNNAFDIFGNPASTTPPCPGDYNADGVRNGADLATLLSAWGTPAGDINGDGNTNGADLSTLLSGWGACPQ